MAASALVALCAISSAAATFTHESFALAPANALSAAPLPVAEHVVPFTGKTPRRSHKTAALHSLRKGRPSSSTNYTDTLAGSSGDEEYLTAITIGGQTFQVIVDTGSSDTWLAEKGFKCFNLTSFPEPTSECGFGSAGFVPSQSKTFKTYPNHNFNISYGDGEFLTGTAGFDDVTVGGLTVSQQEIGLVTNAAWNGDGVNTGLMGLAFSSLTSIYNGNNPNSDGGNNSAPYLPFFLNAIAQKKVKQPIFSISLNRGSWPKQVNSSFDPHLGYLAFGGIAPVPVTNVSVTVPIQGYKVSSSKTPLYEFYNTNIDAYVFPGSTKVKTAGTAILDSGTTLNYVPSAVAKAYNAKWVPPAKFVADEDTYYVNCNATAPAFSVVIGGKSFSIDGRDQVLPGGTDEKGNLLCISGTQDGGPDSDGNIFILGDVFLHNVVATFNLVANTTTLSQRVTY